jgi:hypothetical protein
MEFREFASTEVSALISRLLARKSEESLQQLRSLREALDAAEQALEASPKVDKDIREFVGRLVNAATATIRRVREETKETLETLRGEVATERAESQRLAASLTELQKQSDDLNEKLRNERERADAADRDLAAAREAHEELDAARLKAEELLDAANAETATLSNQLIEETAAAFALRSEIAAVRQALDAADAKAKEVVAKQAAAKADADRAVKESAAQLTAAKADAERAVKEHAAQLAKAKADADRIVKENAAQLAKAKADADHIVKESAAQVAAAKADAERAVKNAAQQAASIAAAEGELSDLRAKLEAALSDVGRLGAQLEASAGERGRLLTSLSTAQGELRTAQEQREGVAAQLKASQARVQVLERAEAQHYDHVRELDAKVNEAMRAESALRAQALSHQQESAGRQAEIAALGAEAERARAVFDACLRGAAELADATTVAGLLAALAKQLATQFSRVAVFRLKGNRLEGETHVGFDQTKDVTKLIIPLTMDSMLTRVVTSGTVESVDENELADGGGTPLGGSPTTAVALPILFHGQTIAVVYADDSGQASRGPAGSDSSIGFARVMLGQTGVLLLRLTHELKTVAELRDYATELLREAEQMHTADAAAGKTADELRRRLKGTLEWARQLFAERVALAGGAGAAVLDEQIVAAVETQTTPFTQNLAAVIGRAREGNVRRAAEAS